MKYIPGFKFTINTKNNKIIQRLNVSYGKFKPNQRYTLIRIQPVADGIEYEFVLDSGESITETFPTTQKADEKIMALAG